MTARYSHPLLATSLMLILASLTLAMGQALPREAQPPYDAALNAMNEAIAQDVPPFPDQPLWAEAIAQAITAADAAPSDARTLGLLAEVYSRSNFHFRAWNAWQTFLAAGHALSATQAPLFLGAGEQMAWSAYERGDLETAASYHIAVLDVIPFTKDARVWMGRIRLEQNRPAEAVPYWEAVVQQDPEDERARYFLELARDQAAWGVTSENAFRDGVTAYESGDLAAAAIAFARATMENDRYPEAWAWRGRVAFERGDYAQAADAYGRAANLDPDKELYRYFEAESERRQGS